MTQNVKVAMAEIEHYLRNIGNDAQKIEALRELLTLEARRQRVDIDVYEPIVARGHTGNCDIEPNDFVYFRNDSVEGKPLSLDYLKAPDRIGEESRISRLAA